MYRTTFCKQRPNDESKVQRQKQNNALLGGDRLNNNNIIFNGLNAGVGMVLCVDKEW